MTSKKFPPIPPYYPAPSEGWNYPQPGPGFPDFQAAEPASGGLHKGQFPGVPAPVFHVDLETNADGVPVADSVGISVRFGKDHKNVLRAIDDVFARGEKGRLNFAPSSYRANNGKDERFLI